MRVTDLMLGDWVRCNDLKRQVAAIGETVGFLDCNNQVYWAYEGFDRIDPIPLTEEILVKNGFKHSMPHNDWTNADCNFFLYEGGNGFRVQNTDIKLDYVHQFQHTLRLCGIEKEIEL